MDDLCPHDTIYSADPPPHPTVGAPVLVPLRVQGC